MMWRKSLGYILPRTHWWRCLMDTGVLWYDRCGLPKQISINCMNSSLYKSYAHTHTHTYVIYNVKLQLHFCYYFVFYILKSSWSPDSIHVYHLFSALFTLVVGCFGPHLHLVKCVPGLYNRTSSAVCLTFSFNVLSLYISG